jgi:hypothetical protein
MQPGFMGFRFEQHSARRPGGTQHSRREKGTKERKRDVTDIDRS